MTCRSGSMIGLPDMLPLSFRKAITEPEKVIAPIATPSPISIRLTRWIVPVGVGDAERNRVEEGRRADQHRGQADQAVEGRDELRHRRHRDPPRGDDADHRADGDRAERSARSHQSSPPGRRWARHARRVMDQGRDDRERHAEHAEPVAAARAYRARQAAQREDEADARDQIGEHHPGGAAATCSVTACARMAASHAWSGAPPVRRASRAPSSCTWRACACVTAKPPKMLTLAITTAARPSHFAARRARAPPPRSARRR